MGRPKLTEKQKADRLAEKLAAGKGGEVEIRDSIRIYFSPLQFARLRDYHKQGGGLPGETIRLAVDAYFRELMSSGEYVPSEAASPEGARAAWAERQTKKRSARVGGEDEIGEDK